MGATNNRFRREVLGLRPESRQDNWRALRRMLVVQGFSPQVVPRPADWPANIHTTGYWFLDNGQAWQPPPGLRIFLDGGAAPVYIGFGSMTDTDPQSVTALIVGALAQSQQRAILQSGWAGLGAAALPNHIFVLDAAPHSWLFPRMSVIVHHGGAGTTAEGLRAGVPTVIVPQIADQPFWGSRVAALGVGPAPIPRHKLTAENLGQAIRQAASDVAMRQRAAGLGARIRSETGLSTAARLIDEYLNRP